MLKLLDIAALVAAFMPFAYAQNGSAALVGIRMLGMTALRQRAPI